MRLTGARALALLLAALLLASCGQSRVVKREGSRVQPPRPVAVAPIPRGDVYTVRRGDTLYGIAFRHGLDFRDVADWNRVAAPYTIYPGQRLRLRGTVSRNQATRSPDARPAPTEFVSVPPPDRRPMPTPPSAAGAPRPALTTVPPAGNPGLAASSPPSVRLSPAAAVPTAPATAPPAAVSAQGWVWPAQGQLIGRYVAGDQTRQGIDIAGSAGQPVLAAADGVVVYSGTGLVGYGEVIIVKHNDEWLSAYGHNRKRLVAEGAVVKGGQAIAELGRSGTSRDMLHFEIRRNGKPVDPLSLLPRR